MITIDQLLESVNYQIEPKWVTKDKDGTICIFGCDKPKTARNSDFWAREEPCITIHHIKLADFENKDWQECIYEVPRKTTGKIEKIEVEYKGSFKIKDWQDIARTVENKINELVDAINELKGAKNEQFNLEKNNRKSTSGTISCVGRQRSDAYRVVWRLL